MSKPPLALARGTMGDAPEVHSLNGFKQNASAASQLYAAYTWKNGDSLQLQVKCCEKPFCQAPHGQQRIHHIRSCFLPSWIMQDVQPEN